MRQATNLNLNLDAHGRRGYCLEYVDNAGRVPYTLPPRLASAQAAFNAESRAKRIRTGQLPLNVWVPIFFRFRTGAFTHLGHIALAKRNSNGTVDIRDSETRAGARSPYRSIAELLAWFGIYSPQYTGWSTHCSGTRYAEPKPKAGRINRSGTARVTAGGLNVRASHSVNSAIVATYRQGQSFRYDSYIDAGGIRWLSYVARSGHRRYAAQKRGSISYVTGGV